MASYEDIQRIAKLLGYADSPEPGEAQKGLISTYKRMQRDGVTFEDLLTLPKSDLFQNTLFKLADLIVKSQENLSPSAQREAYEQYALLIVAKWAGAWDGQTGRGQGDGSSSGSNSNSSEDKSREEAAAEYERRRRAEEAARARNQGGGYTGNASGYGQQGSASGQTQEKPFKSENSQTPKWERVFKFKVGQGLYTFSTAPLMEAVQMLFGQGSITWHTMHQPGRGFRLLGASLLWGMGFAIVILTLAAVLHALTGTGPLWDVRLKPLFSLLTAIGTLWKARVFFQSGWFR